MQFVRRSILGLILCAVAPVASAQAFPAKPIRIISVGAGGITDLAARLVAQKMSASLGQPVVVENHPGANGIVAAQVTAAAAPDGYTIMLGSSGTHALNASLYRKLPYDPVKDFAPVSLVGNVGWVLVANNALPVSNVTELVALAKSKPGLVSLGHTNSTAQLAGVLLFKLTANAEMIPVPYKVGSTATTDLISGQLNVMFETITTALPQINSGRIKALAVPAANRSTLLPNVPTVAESGYPGFTSTSWMGFFAPAGVPKPILAKLNGEIVRALAAPDVRRTLTEAGLEVVGSSIEELEAEQQAQLRKWGRVFQEARLPTLD